MSRNRFPVVARLLLTALLVAAGTAFGAPAYDALTPDQLDQYARARDRGYTHDQALDYSQTPVAKSRDDLTPEQQDDYDTVHGHGGLNESDSLRHATAPPPPPGFFKPNQTGAESDAEMAANRAAAADARARAATLRNGSATAIGSAGGTIGETPCGYDVPQLLGQLDHLTDIGDDTGREALWNALPSEVQQQINNIQFARAAAEEGWFLKSGVRNEDAGAVWAAESAALMNTVGGANAGAGTSLAQRGRDYYGPVIADLTAQQEQIGTELLQAQQQVATFTLNLQMYNDNLPWYGIGGTSRGSFLESGLAAATARVAALTEQYVLITTQLENAQRAAASYDTVAALADLKANAAVRAAEEERRFQAAFVASQALQQQNAQILTGRLAFRDAMTSFETRIAAADGRGDEATATQLRTDLEWLGVYETDWVAMQTHIANGLERDLDNLLAQNAGEHLGPESAYDLGNVIVARGLHPTLDAGQLQQVQLRIATFAGAVGGIGPESITWRDVFNTFDQSIDEAFVNPYELITSPIESLQGNFKFWRRYGSYLYGVGRAAKDGVIDIVVLTGEALDTLLEIDQGIFNVTFGTDVQWFGNENLQFIQTVGQNLSAEQAAEMASAIASAIDRQIEQNAASGERGINDMLDSTGYVAGTILGAEEGAIRGVVIATKYGKVLVKGKKVEQLLDNAAKAERAGSAVAAAGKVDEVVVEAGQAVAGDPFSSPSIYIDDIRLSSSSRGPIPPTVPPGNIPPTVDPIPPTVIPPTIAPRGAGAVLATPTANVPLINPRGGVMRILLIPGELLKGGKRAPDVVRLKFGPYSIDLGPEQWLGRGSTSRTFFSTRNEKLAIKITDAAGKAGLPLDNYGYRLLETAAQSGGIDPTKVRFPKVIEQFPASNGGVVTIVERGPKTIAELAPDGKLTQPMLDAIKNGTEELAKNNLIFPDFKFNNFGLTQLPDKTFVMTILDTGSVMRAKNATVARNFFADIMTPPPELIRAVEAIPASTFMTGLQRAGADAQTIADARVLIDQALAGKPGFFIQPRFPDTAAGKLASDTFYWTRMNAQKTWMGAKYDVDLDFAGLQAGTGSPISTLGPGAGGLTYNPVGGRANRGLREAYGGAPAPGGSGFIGSRVDTPDGPNPFGLGSDVSAPSSGSSLPPPLGFRLGAAKPPPVLGGGAPFMVHAGNGLADDVAKGLNNIELGPFIQRRFVIGATRLFGPNCDGTNVFVLNLTPGQADRVAALDGVVAVEPNTGRSEQHLVDDPLYEKSAPWRQTALSNVGLDGALLAEIARERPRAGAIVAVIDTGVAWGHRDLNARDMWINPREKPGNGVDDDGNGYVDDVVGWNFIDDNALPWDTDGHGTMVAGIIGAGTANGVGIAGINPHARIMALRALDGAGTGRASHVAEAIVYAVRNGAQVINLSLGGRGLTRAEKLAAEFAQIAGVVVVAAAGNDAIELTDWGPAGAAGVIAVGAADGNKRMAPSNWGKRLDLVAPGMNVVSLRSPGTDLMVKFKAGAPLEHVVGSDGAYYRASGTSFAAPIVSGVASVLKQRNAALTPAQVERMLVNSAADIEAPGLDTASGYGLLDARAALRANPDFFIEARLDGVRVETTPDGAVLDVIGSADAARLDSVVLWLGQGASPAQWRRAASFTQPVRDGVLAQVRSSEFAGSAKWTLRLVVADASGAEREARFEVNVK
jgi:subtilisin family serine protease